MGSLPGIASHAAAARKVTIRLMLKDPNLIKRPLIIKENRAYQGYEEKSLLDFVTQEVVAATKEAARQETVLP